MSVLDKTAELVDTLGEAGGPMRLGDLAEAIGMPKSSLHRLINDLLRIGLVRRTSEGYYGLGYRLVTWGRMANVSVGLADLAMPVLVRLRDRIQESVQLYVPDGPRRICVALVDGPHTLRPVVNVGQANLLGFGAAAKLLYALADEDVREEVAALTEPGRRAQLPAPEAIAQMRERRWAMSESEIEEGLTAFAAVVAGPQTPLAAVISCAGSSARMQPERHAGIQEAVIDAAAELERELSRS